MKKVLTIFVSFFMLWLCFIYADDVNMELMPAPTSSGKAAEYVSGVSVWWEVMARQRDLIRGWEMTLWDQLATGIIGRDAILDYCVYLVKFLWELALLTWALAIIFLWYKRITKNVFWESPKGLTMVVVWILVVIFAYVIVKLIWSAFIS